MIQGKKNKLLTFLKLGANWSSTLFQSFSSDFVTAIKSQCHIFDDTEKNDSINFLKYMKELLSGIWFLFRGLSVRKQNYCILMLLDWWVRLIAFTTNKFTFLKLLNTLFPLGCVSSLAALVSWGIPSFLKFHYGWADVKNRNETRVGPFCWSH